MGNPPVRVDLLQKVSGLEYEAAYENRVPIEWHGTPVTLISKEDLITSKKAAGRPQDLVDASNLEKHQEDEF